MGSRKQEKSIHLAEKTEDTNCTKKQKRQKGLAGSESPDPYFTIIHSNITQSLSL